MQFLYGEALSTEIKRIVAEPGARCAVAFWGRGSDEWLHVSSGQKIICDLKMGNTNPYAIEKIKNKAEVRQIEYLHTKIYLGKKSAIVASANASHNALGRYPDGRALLIEAGVYTDQIQDIEIWFDSLWESAIEITDAQIAEAKDDWDRSFPSRVLPFAFFDVEKRRLPLITWLANGELGEVERSSIENLSDDFAVQIIDQVIDNSLPIEQDDKEVISDAIAHDGVWVLCWWADENLLPPIHGQNSPSWKFLSELRENVVFKGDHHGHLALGQPDHLMTAPPFDASETRFIEALRAVLKTPEYWDFIDPNYKAPWFRDRADRFPGFWRDVKTAYEKLSRDS